MGSNEEKRFEVLNHTADVGIKAFGKTLKLAFENAALGMFSLITDLDSVEETVRLTLEAEALDKEVLLAEWLNELIYLFEVERVLLKRFDIIDWDEETWLKGAAWGENLDLARHQVDAQIKACTYHNLKAQKSNGFEVEVIFDV